MLAGVAGQNSSSEINGGRREIRPSHPAKTAGNPRDRSTLGDL